MYKRRIRVGKWNKDCNFLDFTKGVLNDEYNNCLNCIKAEKHNCRWNIVKNT